MNDQTSPTKRTALIAAAAAVVLILLFIAIWQASQAIHRQGTRYTSEPTVQTLEKLSHLVTLKVHIADVLEANTEDGWKNVKGAWLIKGDALLGVDMTKAAIPVLDYTNRYALILLPAPEVLSPRVDHEKTRTYNIKSGNFTPAEFESQVRDNAMREAQRLIDFAARDQENIELARERCEKLLTGFYDLADWTVEVKWQDHTNAFSETPQNAEPSPVPLR